MFAWVLGGTSEGRKLCEMFAAHGIQTVVSIASEYDGNSEDMPQGVQVRVGRLNAEDMRRLIAEGAACVFDAAYAYSQNVSRNARKVCEQTATPYFRVMQFQMPYIGDNVVYVRSATEAASFLAGCEGNALLTVSANSLPVFADIPGFNHRLSVRVPPDRYTLARCQELGFSYEQIIAMKGPFTRELNEALLVARAAEYWVIHSGSDIDSVREKALTAQSVGATIILIERPTETLNVPSGGAKEALKFAYTHLGLSKPARPLFPVFIDLDGKRVVVAGGGASTAKQAESLLAYGAHVSVIAPELSDAMPQGVDVQKRRFTKDDGQGAALIIAATGDDLWDAAIADEAQTMGIPAVCESDADRGSVRLSDTFRDQTVSVGLLGDDKHYDKYLMHAFGMHWPVIRNCAQRNLEAERRRQRFLEATRPDGTDPPTGGKKPTQTEQAVDADQMPEAIQTETAEPIVEAVAVAERAMETRQPIDMEPQVDGIVPQDADQPASVQAIAIEQQAADEEQWAPDAEETPETIQPFPVEESAQIKESVHIGERAQAASPAADPPQPEVFATMRFRKVDDVARAEQHSVEPDAEQETDEAPNIDAYQIDCVQADEAIEVEMVDAQPTPESVRLTDDEQPAPANEASTVAPSIEPYSPSYWSQTDETPQIASDEPPVGRQQSISILQSLEREESDRSLRYWDVPSPATKVETIETVDVEQAPEENLDAFPAQAAEKPFNDAPEPEPVHTEQMEGAAQHAETETLPVIEQMPDDDPSDMAPETARSDDFEESANVDKLLAWMNRRRWDPSARSQSTPTDEDV